MACVHSSGAARCPRVFPAGPPLNVWPSVETIPTVRTDFESDARLFWKQQMNPRDMLLCIATMNARDLNDVIRYIHDLLFLLECFQKRILQ